MSQPGWSSSLAALVLGAALFAGSAALASGVNVVPVTSGANPAAGAAALRLAQEPRGHQQMPRKTPRRVAQIDLPDPTKDDPIKDDPIKDDPIKDDPTKTEPPRAAGLEKALVGVWRGQKRQGVLVFILTSRLNPDNTYVTITFVQQTGSTVQVWGKWSATEIMENEGTLIAEPKDWRPREYCIAEGVCQPLLFSTETQTVKVLNRTTIEVGGITFRRLK